MIVVRKSLLMPALALLLCVPARADQSNVSSAPPAPAQASAATAAPAADQTPQPPPPAPPPPAPAPAQATTPPPAPPAAPPPPPPPPPKNAPAPPLQIKVSDTVNFRFGVLLQPQVDFSQGALKGTSQNFLVRRVRFITSGQMAKSLFFFYQTENNRLGNSSATTGSKTLTTGFQTVDAVGEYRFSKPFNVWAGLIYLPTSREALKSSGSEFMIDVNSYAYTATAALAGTAGRDTGVMARGYFLGDRLEYRAGAFAGLRDTGSRQTFRKIARVQYNFFDTEVYNLPSYAGTNYGTRKILAVGAAYDGQKSYRGTTADVYVDFPTSFGSALGTVTYMMLDGKSFVTALPKSNIFVVDGGFFMKTSKVGPWLRYEQREFAAPNKSRSEKRYLAGINYCPLGNSFNIKTAVGQLKPEVGKNQNQFTVQLQFFIY